MSASRSSSSCPAHRSETARGAVNGPALDPMLCVPLQPAAPTRHGANLILPSTSPGATAPLPLSLLRFMNPGMNLHKPLHKRGVDCRPNRATLCLTLRGRSAGSLLSSREQAPTNREPTLSSRSPQMRRCLLLIAFFAVSTSAALPFAEVKSPNESDEAAGCSKEQYKEKFGALPTYELHTFPLKPSLEDGFVRAKVASSLCTRALYIMSNCAGRHVNTTRLTHVSPRL